MRIRDWSSDVCSSDLRVGGDASVGRISRGSQWGMRCASCLWPGTAELAHGCLSHASVRHADADFDVCDAGQRLPKHTCLIAAPFLSFRSGYVHSRTRCRTCFLPLPLLLFLAFPSASPPGFF